MRASSRRTWAGGPERRSARTLGALAVCATLVVGCESSSSGPTDAGADASARDAGVDAAPDAATPRAIAELVRVDEVVLTQAVEIALARGSALVEPRNAPVVAGRTGLLRVLVTPLDGPVSLHATLDVVHAAGTDHAAVDALVESASDRGVLGSTLDLPLAAAAVTTDTAVAITITADGADGALHWPATGTYPLAARSTLAPLRIAFVPVTTMGVTPTLGATELAAYRTRMLDLYPIDDVHFEVLPPETFSGDLCTLGGWVDLQLQVLARRAADAPADGVFYGGLVQLPDFRCTGVGGLTTSIDGPTNPAHRVFVAYAMDPATARDSATTVAHELGHVLGRDHAPCGGAGSPDAAYPYASGLVGVWGWSASRNALFDPTLYTDLMGYCSPTWISDYEYSAIFDAIVTVHTREAMP